MGVSSPADSLPQACSCLHRVHVAFSSRRRCAGTCISNSCRHPTRFACNVYTPIHHAETSPSGCRIAPCTARPAVRARLNPAVASASAEPPPASCTALPLCCASPLAAAEALDKALSDASCAESCMWISTAFRRARPLTKLAEHHCLCSLSSTCLEMRTFRLAAVANCSTALHLYPACKRRAAHLLIHPENC